MKLLPLPTKEERQARTPYHAILDDPKIPCMFPDCPEPVIGIVEFDATLENGQKIQNIQLAVCDKHQVHFWEKKDDYRLDRS